MVLTPLDIHNKEFPVKMRGYDQDEVNDYLDQIIKDYEMVLKENRELEKNLKFANEKVEHFTSLQEALNKSIIVAQEAADRLSENSYKEADIIRMEAEKNADRLLADAVAKAKNITSETEELRKQSQVFKQRLQLMLEAQLELVKNKEWDSVLNYSPQTEAETPLLDELLSSDDSDNVEEDTASNAGNTVVSINSKLDTQDHFQEEDELEGTLPAIELP